MLDNPATSQVPPAAHKAKKRGRSPAKMLSVEPASMIDVTTPGRGRGPSFIPSIEDLSQASSSTQPFENKTNKQADPETTGMITRSRSNMRLHTPEKPDWAVAPDEPVDNAPNRSTARKSSRNSLNGSRSDHSITGKQSKRRRTSTSGANLDPEAGVVEVNGRWARGTWKRSRGRS